MLNKRLYAVTELIEPCDVLMDVGSDHGFLPLNLLLNNRIQKAIIGDLNSGPLEQAIKNFANYQELSVEFVLSNGISNYKGKLDAVVIAGMGYETIQNIIQKDIDRFKEIPQIILQSNTKIDELRRFLNTNKFSIIDESIIKDRKYYYPILKARYDINTLTLTEQELLYGPILIKNKTNVFMDYLRFKKSIEEKINVAQKKDSSERIQLLNEILDSK